MVILAGVSEGAADHWGFQEGVKGGILGGICGVCVRECDVWGVCGWGVVGLNSAGTMVVEGRNEQWLGWFLFVSLEFLLTHGV